MKLLYNYLLHTRIQINCILEVLTEAFGSPGQKGYLTIPLNPDLGVLKDPSLRPQGQCILTGVAVLIHHFM